MLSLERKTKVWADKNIISAAQRQQILEEEHIAHQPFVYYGFVWLGLFLAVLGIGSILRFYWQSIPEWVKLSTAGILLIGSLVVAFLAIRQQRQRIAEVALFIAFFMIGGGIGLVAQIFNLPVDSTRGLFLWLILSFGIVIISRRQWLAFLWIPLFFGGIIGYMRLELLLLFFEQSPLFATTLLAGILICLIYLSHFFTDKFAVSLYHWSIVLYFPVVFLGDMAMKSPFNGFLLSMGFLGLLLFFAITSRRSFLYNVTLFFILARILIFYFQSTDDLTHTGIGFLGAGLVLLAGAGFWLFWRKNRIKHKKTRVVSTHKTENAEK